MVTSGLDCEGIKATKSQELLSAHHNITGWIIARPRTGMTWSTQLTYLANGKSEVVKEDLFFKSCNVCQT